ncbi:MAG: hypothetical protein H7325_13110 [Pedobacter sp.]|nr:hypothetical protein [Pedobacter sp.]
MKNRDFIPRAYRRTYGQHRQQKMDVVVISLWSALVKGSNTTTRPQQNLLFFQFTGQLQMPDVLAAI